jgi:hypothetical protein
VHKVDPNKERYVQYRRGLEKEVQDLRQKLSLLRDDQGDDQIADRKKLQSRLNIAEMTLQAPQSLLYPGPTPHPFPAAEFGLEGFLHSFSEDRAADTRDPPKLRSRNFGAISASLFRWLGEPFNHPLQCWNFLMIARYQYRETGNPLWAWLVLRIYSGAELPPPAWVWEYLLKAALCATEGATDLRPLDEASDKGAKYSDAQLVETLGLKKRAGKRDHFTEFRKIVTDFRLAIQVRNLAFPDDLENGVRLMEACQQVFNRTNALKRRATRSETRAGVKQIWKAYHRWFEKDGGFWIVPHAR